MYTTIKEREFALAQKKKDDAFVILSNYIECNKDNGEFYEQINLARKNYDSAVLNYHNLEMDYSPFNKK